MTFTMLLVLCFGYICMASGNDYHFSKNITSSCMSFIQDSKGGVQVCLSTTQKMMQAEVRDNMQKYKSDRQVLRSKLKKTACCSTYGMLDCVASAVKSSGKCSTSDQAVLKDEEGDSLRSAFVQINGVKEVIDCTKFDKTNCYIITVVTYNGSQVILL